MQALPHQLSTSKLVFDMLRKHKYCYLQGEVRCVDKDTEFLSRQGWKPISEYKQGEEVCQWGIDGTTKFIIPSEYHVYPNSKLTEVIASNVNFCFTDTHRMPYTTSKNNIAVKTFKELRTRSYVRMPATFSLPTNVNSTEIPLALLKVLIMHTADGTIKKLTTKDNLIIVNVKKKRKQNRCRQLLIDAGIEFKEWKSSPEYIRFSYSPPQEINFKSLEPLWNTPLEYLQDIYNELLFWDGSIYTRKDTNKLVYSFTGNKANTAVFQYIASCATSKVVSMDKDNREYITEDIYSSRVGQLKHKFLQFTNSSIREFIDTAYCFTTESGFWLMRRGNKILPTGNSGKTLTALLAISYSKSISRILVLTKKSAISGITKFINDPELSNYWSHQQHTVTNYEAIGSMVTRTTSASGKPIKPVVEPKLKLNPDDYDFIIVDEAHSLGKLGKPTQRYKLLKLLAGDKPWLAMSGTPFVESINQIYYQTSFSTKSPFPHKSFYRYFDEWGVPSSIQVGRDDFINSYKLAHPALISYIDSFSVKLTQQDAGILTGSKPQLHYVELSTLTKTWYNTLQSSRVLKLPTATIVGDSLMALTKQLQQLESGVIRIDDEYLELGNTEKIDYLKSNFNMDSNTVILAYYIGEQQLLRRYFPQCTVDSITRKAEGVDYSNRELILFSLGWSGAKGIQVADRGVNLNNTEPSVVHYILSRGCMSELVYDCVSNKQQFNSKQFKPKELT